MSTKPQKTQAHIPDLVWRVASESLGRVSLASLEEHLWTLIVPPLHPVLPVHATMCASERGSYHQKGQGVVLAGLPNDRERARAAQPWPQHQGLQTQRHGPPAPKQVMH